MRDRRAAGRRLDRASSRAWMSTHVADAVLYMASLPLDANVQFMTVMATKMPFVGRGSPAGHRCRPLADRHGDAPRAARSTTSSTTESPGSRARSGVRDRPRSSARPCRRSRRPRRPRGARPWRPGCRRRRRSRPRRACRATRPSCTAAAAVSIESNVTPIHARWSAGLLRISLITGRASSIAIAKPTFSALPALAATVLMPIEPAGGVDERAAGIAGIDRSVGLEQSLEDRRLRRRGPCGRARRRCPGSRSGRRRARAGSRSRARRRRAGARDERPSGTGIEIVAS